MTVEPVQLEFNFVLGAVISFHRHFETDGLTNWKNWALILHSHKKYRNGLSRVLGKQAPNLSVNLTAQSCALGSLRCCATPAAGYFQRYAAQHL